MDIHPPTKPVESVKDYLIHLSMITVGILIALGMEQAVEAWRHHEIAAQARENILSEIRDNKKEIDADRANIEANQKKLQHGLDVVKDLLAHRKLGEIGIEITGNLSELRTTAWSTASAMGALAYMGYADAERFAGVYNGQAILESIQQESVRAVVTAMADARFVLDNPGKASDDQLRMVQRGLLACMAQNESWLAIEGKLSEEYAKVLAGK
jgi:hypothetical protein